MALREIGIAIDSSVAPEMMARDSAAWYDFSKSPQRAWWPVKDDVMSVAERSDFVEIPITTGRVNPLKHVYARAARRRQGELAEGCSGSYRKPAGARGEILDVLKKLSGSNRAMLDYCVLPTALLTQVTRDWIHRFGAAQRPVPVVAIGHTKNFSRAAEESLDNFLRWAACAGNIELSSYETWLTEASPDLTAAGGMIGAKNEHLI